MKVLLELGRNTGSLCRSLKIETIEKKVAVGSAVQKHGFVFNYQTEMLVAVMRQTASKVQYLFVYYLNPFIFSICIFCHLVFTHSYLHSYAQDIRQRMM